MEPIYLTKIVRVGTSLGVIIPKEILNAYEWQRGDQIVFIPSTAEFLGVKRITDQQVKELKAADTTITLDTPLKL